MTRPGFFITVALLSLMVGCAREPLPPSPDPLSTRTLDTGTVVGFADRFDTWSWRGIPFAQAPVGELRWRAPRPALPWQGTLEALAFSPWCPQLPIPVVNDTDEPWLGDEDCLYLNVSAPRAWAPGDPPLPVMVWLHGGGNTVGSADLYNAVRNLAAREQVITVSIHYRLGVLGWFAHPALRENAANDLDASGNFGTLDTIAALHWVQENIGVFGGDPANVTLFGESAGGMNTFALLLSPLAENLFHRAISQSGMLLTSTVASAENATDADPPGSVNSSTELLLRLLQADGSAADREGALQQLAKWDAATTMAYLRTKTPGQLLAGMRESDYGLYPIPNMLRDGVVLPLEEPLDLLAQGRFNRVPVIMGTNRDEVKSLMVRNPDYTRLRFGVLPQPEDQALYDRVTGYGSAMWKAVGADEPAAAMTAAGHRDVFVYRFDWDDIPSNWLLDFKALLGAGHSFEMPFVFHDLDNEMTYMPFDLIDEDNIEQAQPLAEAMSSYWGQFAQHGDPNREGSGGHPRWVRWGSDGQFLVLATSAQGGIRMQQGALERATIFRQLVQDGEHLGGANGVCLAYDNLFGENAIFQFAAKCPPGQDCPGAREHFCPTEP